jgi:hypothetical protein
MFAVTPTQRIGSDGAQMHAATEEFLSRES